MNDDKILFLAGCSKSKLDHPAIARELFTGQLFRMILKLVKKLEIDMKIISGKHEILDLNQLIEPYDLKIITKGDIIRIKRKIFAQLIDLYTEYEKIIILLGSNYRKAISPIIDAKSHVITHKKGLFGYISLISRWNKMSDKQTILNEIYKYRYSECFHASCNSNNPKNCFFCDYFEENTCHFLISTKIMTLTNKNNNYLEV